MFQKTTQKSESEPPPPNPRPPLGWLSHLARPLLHLPLCLSLPPASPSPPLSPFSLSSPCCSLSLSGCPLSDPRVRDLLCLRCVRVSPSRHLASRLTGEFVIRSGGGTNERTQKCTCAETSSFKIKDMISWAIAAGSDVSHSSCGFKRVCQMFQYLSGEVCDVLVICFWSEQISASLKTQPVKVTNL